MTLNVQYSVVTDELTISAVARYPSLHDVIIGVVRLTHIALCLFLVLIRIVFALALALVLVLVMVMVLMFLMCPSSPPFAFFFSLIFDFCVS